jgi:serine/threonine protein kinase
MSEPLNLTTISHQTWQRVSDLFDEVIELAEGDRITFIRELWVTEPQVASELAALLVAAAKVEKTQRLAQAPFDSMLSDALAKQSAANAAYKPGQKFGAWTLEECIGQGGMGEVWRVKRSDGLYKASAALKIVRSDLSNEKLSARFRRERVVLARLNHPNIARLLDAGIEQNQAFIVLELVKGMHMLDYVTQHTKTLADRVSLIRDIAIAVEHAHSQLVLHRDLKPSNVLVTADGQIKLLDFGIAGVLDNSSEEPMTKLTQLTGRGLTLEYASPEQITGEATVAASDVYSLGVLLFHLCTGNRPFAGSSTRAALEYAMVNSDPPRPSDSIATKNADPNNPALADQINPPVDAYRLRGDLDAIISRAMRLVPAERYQTAAALASDLDAWMTARPTSLHAGDRTYASRLWFIRHWKIVSTIAVSILLVISALGVSLWQRSVALSTADATARHLDGVMAQLPALSVVDAEATVEAKRQYAMLLLRLNRPMDALTVLDDVTPLVIARYGKTSPINAKLLVSRSAVLTMLGRTDEASAAQREAALIGKGK